MPSETPQATSLEALLWKVEKKEPCDRVMPAGWCNPLSNTCNSYELLRTPLGNVSKKVIKLGRLNRLSRQVVLAHDHPT